MHIACWGSAQYGGSNPPSASYVWISSGDTCNYAVRDDGWLRRWGDCVHIDESNYACSTGRVPGDYTQISVSSSSACGIVADSTLCCLGGNYSRFNRPPSGTFIDISASSGNYCTIRTGNTVECWSAGGCEYGECDAPSGTFIKVSAGGNHVCAIKTGNTLECWGRNDDGQSTPPES